MSDTCSCHPGSPSTRHQGTLTSIPFQLYSSPGGIAGVFHLSSDVNGTGLWSVILFRWFVILMCGLLCSSHTDVGRFPRGKYSLGGNCEIRSGYPRSMVTVQSIFLHQLHSLDSNCKWHEQQHMSDACRDAIRKWKYGLCFRRREKKRNNMLADVLIPPQLWLFLSHI